MNRALKLSLLAIFFVLSACARNRAPVEVVDTTIPLKSITLITVTSPEKLYTENFGVPVFGAVWTGLANMILDPRKSAEFEEKYGQYRQTMGAKMTAALKRELEEQGFTVRLLNTAEVERGKKKLTSV